MNRLKRIGHKLSTVIIRFFRAAATPPADRYASTFGVVVGGVLFVVFGLVFFSALVNLWPAVESTGSTSSTTDHSVVLGWGIYTAHVTKSTGLLLLALSMGAIGGYIHAATSFVSYIGNREFKASWGWWYVLRAFIGASLALFIYLAFRAGFLTAGSATGDIDPYGVAAVSGLAGLFSKQATDKLEEIFNTAFHTTSGIGDRQRRDTISADHPPPVIDELTPNSVASDRLAAVTAKGRGFARQAIVQLDGAPQDPTAWSATELTFQIAPGQYLTPGKVQVAVVNPDGTRSVPHTLTIT